MRVAQQDGCPYQTIDVHVALGEMRRLATLPGMDGEFEVGQSAWGDTVKTFLQQQTAPRGVQIRFREAKSDLLTVPQKKLASSRGRAAGIR